MLIYSMGDEADDILNSLYLSTEDKKYNCVKGMFKLLKYTFRASKILKSKKARKGRACHSRKKPYNSQGKWRRKQLQSKTGSRS